MRPRRIGLLAIISFAAAIGVANASWYDDYEDGIKAARAGNWQRVVDTMSKAIAGNKTEANNARTYGAIFINYKPYYYRGVAYLNLGKNEQAIADLEKTLGPGQLDLGPIEIHIKTAKDRLRTDVPTPQPTPQPQPTPVPVPVPVPQPPSIDPALRTRAESAIESARARLAAAQQRNAVNTNEYKEAMTQFREANRRLNAAASNDDMRAVANIASEVVLLADSANVITPVPTPVPVNTTAQVEGDVLGATRRNLRGALESYFEGDFVNAERRFKRLSVELPKNPWIWAFLGASQWSRYAFETEDYLRVEAINSFKQAKRNGWKGGLPQKYFSRRIRNAFERNAG